MAPSNTSIILCSGAWHNEHHIKPAVPALEKAGYSVIPRPLASALSKGGWDEDVAAFESAIKTELDKGQNVALILHSAAGPPGCEAVNNILSSRGAAQSSKIVELIFVASFIRDDERDAITANLFESGFLRLGTGSDEGTLFAENGHRAFFNDMSVADAAPYIDGLGAQTAYASLGVTSEKWKEVSLTYMLCGQDNVAKPDVQEWVAKNHGMDVVRINAAHDPYVSQPEEFARLVDQILSA
ncbi:hypothetical protein LTR09_005023 [Extremus antarcticus]|uniref:AB hydrolase-1 domain-containing protein n=1 Tax=Extremus antarcticus TaxID=702011 RepID=A0AAJ0DND5_9PEZI|nr:hypothetical protein LTR09_005023 [Extremus antarcticus]